MKKFFYPLVLNPFRDKDIYKAKKVLSSKKITMGKEVKLFEKTFKKKTKVKHALMVNSGSSANLLVFQCLINPYRKKKLNPKDEIIIPTLCWSTSLWPIVQSGLKPVFVDVDLETMNISIEELKKKITKKTKAIMLVHVLGNSTNLKELVKLAKKYKLIVVEDTCESLGSKYSNKYLGTFGDFSTFSFYTSHQISAGEGGMVCTKDKNDYEIIKSLRSHGWSRDLSNEKYIANKNKHLDKKFIFYNSGFNLRSTEISATLAQSQFNDLDKFIKTRNLNRQLIIKKVNQNKKISKNIKFLKENKNLYPSWFGIPIYLNKKINKKIFCEKLEYNGVETRPIISGNFINQPSIKKYKLFTKEKFKNATHINNHCFFIGLPFVKLKKNIINKLIIAFEKSL